MELLGGRVGKLQIQKLLFLYSKMKEDPEYEFVPYKFGCYSYSANADLRTMVKRGLLSQNEKSFFKEEGENFFIQLSLQDQDFLKKIVDEYGDKSIDGLIKHTYINFPFYAINSTIAKDVLTGEDLEKIEKAKPENSVEGIYTIGYEGISLEKYLLKLIRSQIPLLVDVRRNARSMKFGFSKKSLQRYCESLGIKYIHMPEVGIASEKRRNLSNQKDYDNLFVEYRETTLNNTKQVQEDILSLLGKYKRIALTCFEAEPCQCHRTHLAQVLCESTDFHYPLIHL